MSSIEYQREWRRQNADRVREHAAAYRKKNKAKISASARRWREENREELLAKKRAYYTNNKERHKAATRRSALKRQYGITHEQFEVMLTAQDHRCANPGCRTDNPGGKGWHVDHCHATGRVRGILCNHCNLMLGYARDNPKALLGAAEYLRRG